jgi:long-chain acyl-CoA synthetase
MRTLLDDPRMLALTQATTALIAPGQPFEVVPDVVRGELMTVFARRHRSLRDVVVEGSARDGDAYVFGDGERISYRAMERQAASVAAALAARHGIGPGDRVAICAANCSAWIQLFWAVASLDAVLVAMNGWWTGVEMRHALELAAPQLVVMDERRHARLDADPGAPTLVVERDFAPLLDDQDAPVPTAPIAEDDPFMLIFTSGTTGRPKAALLSHRCVIGYLQFQAFLEARGLAAAGVTGPVPPPVRLAPFPLFHVSGLSATVSTMLGAGTTVWPLGRFDPEEVIELTRREGITAWMGAEAQMLRLLDSPAIETLDPTLVRRIGSGGSATTPAFIRKAESRFPHITNTISSGYGSTETGGLVSFAPNWMLQAAPDCVGPPLPTVEVRITDEHGEPVAAGVEGNVEARSPIVMLEYWRNDAATAETLRPGLWVRTGDFGRLDDGLLFIASRRRDLIIRGGENIYPFEIEHRLDEHPDVVEVAVVGVDHPTLGQEVQAVVIVREGSALTAADVRAWCAETLASYKIPAHVVLRTDPLPRNATGKVMKHALAPDAATIFVEE